MASCIEPVSIDGAYCDVDSDCGELICVQHKCIEPIGNEPLTCPSCTNPWGEAKYYCDQSFAPGTGQCVKCLKDHHCWDEGANACKKEVVGEKTIYTCVSCLNDLHCTDGQFCDAQANTCKQCKTDVDCGAGSVCEHGVDGNQCVAIEISINNSPGGSEGTDR